MSRRDNRGSIGAYPSRDVEFLFAKMMMGWGLWLLVPWWQTFSNPAYAGLNEIAPEAIWGVISFAVGAGRYAVLVINGRYCRTPLLRFAASLLGVNWWAALIWLFYVSPIPNPPACYVFYPLFLWHDLESCRRSMADAFRANAFRPLRLPRILILERSGDAGQ